MHLEKLRRGELIAVASGILLAVSLFLDWYATSSDRFATIDGRHPAIVSAWEHYTILRYVLLVAAVAPLILAYIVVREHQLSWPRGEVTAVVAITAFVLVLVVGFVTRPGDPRSQINLQVGWFVALAATIGMMVGAAQRTAESGRARKPPGTL